MNARKPLWIVGQGGFLGSAIHRASIAAEYQIFSQGSIPWGDAEARRGKFEQLTQDFADFVGVDRGTIIWAAGAEGVATTFTPETTELSAFKDFAHSLSNTQALHGSSLTVCSSAGGVYSGSTEPPFTVSSPVNAINQYGLDKIATEQLALAELSGNFIIHIARITNLYGPWSGPRQGLINRLCTAAAKREAIRIYVPLETVRDYIYVDDAAQLLLLELGAQEQSESPSNVNISLIGSGQNSSIASVIKSVSSVTHRKVPITFSQLDATFLQPTDLRMHPSWCDRDPNFTPISFPNGIKRLFDSLITVPRWN